MKRRKLFTLLITVVALMLTVGCDTADDSDKDAATIIEDGTYDDLTIENGVVVKCTSKAPYLKLFEVAIPNGVQASGEEAFNKCSKLTNIEFKGTKD